ncbi:MAG: hypothetical protein ACRD44_10320 [Bryobacteraceae bacterium]
MEPHSLGKIAVSTPGTPVPFTTNATLLVSRVRVQTVIGETGRIWLGVSGMNKNTHVGVMKQFWPTGASGAAASMPADSWEINESGGDNTIQLSSLFLDAAVAGEGAIVEYWLS